MKQQSKGMMNMARWMLIFAVWLTSAFAAWPAAARGPALVAAGIAASSLPAEARKTYTLIFSGGPYPYARDGDIFGNYEKALPPHPRGFYREFTVRTPGARNRGARRIVCGGTKGEWARNRPQACYYSDDHYTSFHPIRG